jgi:hypothetical protein
MPPALSSFTVVSWTIEVPRVSLDTVGGVPVEMVSGRPKVSVEVKVSVAEADRVDLMARYSDGERIEFNGYPFAIVEPSWHQGNVEPSWHQGNQEGPYMAFTLVGTVAREDLPELEARLRGEPQQAETERQKVHAAAEAAARREVEANRALGTLEDLT